MNAMSVVAACLLIGSLAVDPGAGEGLQDPHPDSRETCDLALQNDAGSGRDAPDGPVPEVWVEPYVTYSGYLTAPACDFADWYAFNGSQGQRVHVRVTGDPLCGWNVHDSKGHLLPTSCHTAGTWLSFYATLPEDGLYFISVQSETPPRPYWFAFGLDHDAPMFADSLLSVGPNHRFGVDECPGAPPGETMATHGSGDSEIATLAWAALKTGFRAGVVWTTETKVSSVLRVLQTDGNVTLIEGSGPTDSHAFVLDLLPQGRLLCFQAEHTGPSGTVTSDWHVVRLANAQYSYDEQDGVYTMNLLVLANEHLFDREVLEEGLEEFARFIWGAADGHVRAGAIIVIYGDLDRHNSGFLTCGLLVAQVVNDNNNGHDPMPTCISLVDVVFSYDNVPSYLATTYSDGIEGRWAHVYMNNLWRGPSPLTSTDRIAGTLLHEIGHYAFGMMDLYGFTADDCHDPETRISVMGSSVWAREFDDSVTRCPDWEQIPGYRPSWNDLMARYTMIPDRPNGPVEGPNGTGGAFHIHTLEYVAELTPFNGLV